MHPGPQLMMHPKRWQQQQQQPQRNDGMKPPKKTAHFCAKSSGVPFTHAKHQGQLASCAVLPSQHSMRMHVCTCTNTKRHCKRAFALQTFAKTAAVAASRLL
jgi:hypothetical protein